MRFGKAYAPVTKAATLAPVGMQGPRRALIRWVMRKRGRDDGEHIHEGDIAE